MTNPARQAILNAIRTHLAASPTHDPHLVNPKNPAITSPQPPTRTLIERFKQSLELVDGHCIITTDVTAVLSRIIMYLKAQRLAISDHPDVERFLHATDLEIEELGIAPNARDIFRFDVGITSAQAAIAETGTLVLDSTYERHRLVSLVPPVHIAIINASSICATLSDALTLLQNEKEISPTVTFITGPSRTGDIEMTLTIGVHGPQALYVIINESS